MKQRIIWTNALICLNTFVCFFPYLLVCTFIALLEENTLCMLFSLLNTLRFCFYWGKKSCNIFWSCSFLSPHFSQIPASTSLPTQLHIEMLPEADRAQTVIASAPWVWKANYSSSWFPVFILFIRFPRAFQILCWLVRTDKGKWKFMLVDLNKIKRN